MVNGIVSIITPSFNRADIVSETAASIMAQTYSHWEWVVVDDGSTDNSMEVLQAFARQDSRIKIFSRNRTPKGACACRNIAVENCTGDYLMFLDTDDVLAPFCLEQRVQTMASYPDADFVVFPMLLFKNKLNDLNKLWNIDNDRDDIERILTSDAACQGTGPLWKKSTFVKIGMWREDMAFWQDVELHLRSLLWPVKYVKRLDLQPDVYLRVSDTSLSRSGYYTLPKLNSRIYVLKFLCERMAKLRLLTRYHEVVSMLANDICISAIVGGHFKQGSEVIKLADQHHLFTKNKTRHLKAYLFVRKSRMSKLAFIDKYFHDAAKTNLPEQYNIGHHNWQPLPLKPQLI